MNRKTGKRPPASAKPPTEPARKLTAAFRRKPTTRTARERFVVEMHRLRSVFGEIAERFAADTEARIAALIEAAKDGSIPAGKIPELLETVRDLQVKPQKGRRKDLARVERVVGVIERALSE
jgi:hypothetical protein